jgi:crotonobetaine/carnitine-CoA ligase
VHYLGIIAPLLLGQPAGEDERRHAVALRLGAGIEPQLHAPFEQRFGFPLIELWGMTEMVRALSDNFAPRQVGTRAFGRAVPASTCASSTSTTATCRTAARRDAGAPLGGNAAPGLLLRLSRRRGGDGGGLAGRLVPYRRRGRRAGRRHAAFRRPQEEHHPPLGENIAAAEVEAVLLTHPTCSRRP